MEEFTIKATGHAINPDREWTRSRLSAARSIAKQAVEDLGYKEADVINNYSGTIVIHEIHTNEP